MAAPRLDDIVTFVRDDLITEIRTEAATAEIAWWTIGVCAAVIVVSTWVPLARRDGRGWTAAAEYGWRVLRIAAVAVLFGEVVVQVVDAGWLTRADQPTLSWLLGHRSPLWTAVAVTVTEVASPVGTALAGIAVAGYFWRRYRRYGPAVLLLVIVAATAVVNTGVKMVIARARPPLDVQLLTETDYSFPSGHTAGLTALAGSVIVVYGAHRSRRWTGWAVVIAVLLVVSVAVTRLYLGVHWLSDTLGGALLGVLMVLIGATVGAACGLSGPRPRRTPGIDNPRSEPEIG